MVRWKIAEIYNCNVIIIIWIHRRGNKISFLPRNLRQHRRSLLEISSLRNIREPKLSIIASTSRSADQTRWEDDAKGSISFLGRQTIEQQCAKSRDTSTIQSMGWPKTFGFVKHELIQRLDESLSAMVHNTYISLMIIDNDKNQHKLRYDFKIKII